MNEQYYESVKTGAILRETKIEGIMRDIYGSRTYKESWCDKLVKNGTIKKIENPTVIDFLKRNDRIGAVIRYREIHNSSLGAAYSMVNKVAEDMKAFAKR